MAINTLVPWFGSNRLLAHEVGKLLDGCKWVGVPFAGGMSELRHIKARTMLVGDLHKHVIALALAVGHPEMGPELVRRLRRWPLHEDALKVAQRRCRDWEDEEIGRGRSRENIIQWAEDYFVCAWMARNGTAGTDGEFSTGLSVRWDAGGGDSATRYRNAVESLKEWKTVLARCTFVCLDVFEFLKKAKDRDGHGLYLDPPFPGPGDEYKHKFTRQQHGRLALWLTEFAHTRVVCRFYDHPLIRELYPEPLWTWHEFTGRTQTNAKAPEVLLVRNG